MSKKRKIRSYNLLSRFDNYLPGWGGMFILLAFLLLGGILSSVVAILVDKLAPELTQFNTVFVYPLVFIPALAYASVKSTTAPYSQRGLSNIDKSHFGGKQIAILALVTSLATIAGSFIIEPSMLLLPEMPEFLENMLKNLTQGMPLWASLLTVSIFAPFFEEILCRGLILRGLAQRMSPTNAIIISSIFFALIHGNPWQAIPAFGLGMLFGFVYYKTGSLKLAMLMHCVNNTFSVILSNMEKFKDVDYIYQVMRPVDYGIVYVLMLVALGLSIYYIAKLPPRTSASA